MALWGGPTGPDLGGLLRPTKTPLKIPTKSAKSGRSSVVERQLPKLYVVGSIPFARSRPYMSSPETWVTERT